ncbi:MAG: beta-phosphoglucomutase [Flavobacteriaceae bacterium]
MKKFPTFIFDLDGVITNTEKHHYQAWKIICNDLGYDLTKEKNEQLKGVSRDKCLLKILKWTNLKISQSKFEDLLNKKNKIYLEMMSKLNSSNIINGVHDFILNAKEQNHSVALYSSSKNAKFILNKLKLHQFFDAIVDGNSVKASKPDPEGFIIASRLTNSDPINCVVFEDSEAGIIAGNKIKMTTIGIGNSEKLNIANKVYKNFKEIKFKDFQIC